MYLFITHLDKVIKEELGLTLKCKLQPKCEVLLETVTVRRPYCRLH